MAGHTYKFIFSVFRLHALSNIMDNRDDIDHLSPLIIHRAGFNKRPAFKLPGHLIGVSNDRLWLAFPGKHAQVSELGARKRLSLFINDLIPGNSTHGRRCNNSSTEAEPVNCAAASLA